MGVYKRNGMYWCRFKLGGTRYHRSCNTRSLSEAQVFEQQLKTSLCGAEVPQTVPVQVQEPVAEMPLSVAVRRIWEEEWQSIPAGPHQYNRMLWVVEQFNDPLLVDIDDQFLEQLKRKLHAAGRSTTTVNQYLAHMRKILRTAKLAWKVPLELPWFRIKQPNNQRNRTITLEEQAQMIKLLRGAIDGDYADLFELLIETGMRLGEPLSMTWEHVDFTNKLLNLTADITKGSKPRSIPLSTKAHQILNRRLKQGLGTPFPYTKNQCEYVFRYVKRVLGITDPELCWHSCRHTFASRLILNGVDLYTVSKLLGHSSIVVTERYSHMSVTQLRDAVNKLEGAGAKHSAPPGGTPLFQLQKGTP